MFPERDADLSALAHLVGLTHPDHDEPFFTDRHVADVEPDEFAPSHRAGLAEKNQRSITDAELPIGQPYRYDPAQSLLSTDVPALTHMAEVMTSRPWWASCSAIPPVGRPVRGLGVIDLEPPLLEAVGRHLGLLDAPDEIPVLAPLVLREIAFRLLVRPEGVQLRQIVAAVEAVSRVQYESPSHFRKEYWRMLSTSPKANETSLKARPHAAG